jgi:hypothetical protein
MANVDGRTEGLYYDYIMAYQRLINLDDSGLDQLNFSRHAQTFYNN